MGHMNPCLTQGCNEPFKPPVGHKIDILASLAIEDQSQLKLFATLADVVGVCAVRR